MKDAEVNVDVVPVRVTMFPVVASSLVKEPEVTFILGPIKEPEREVVAVIVPSTLRLPSIPADPVNGKIAPEEVIEPEVACWKNKLPDPSVANTNP